MPVTFLLTDDATAATALTFGPTGSGNTSATQILHMWNSKGTPGGALANLSIQAVDPTTGLDNGVPWLDETWLEVRANGGANPSGDPAFLSMTTDWYRIGNGVSLPLPDLPGDCAYYIEIRFHPPLKEGAPTESVNFELRASYSENTFPLAGALSDLGQGIVTGVGDNTVTEFVEAPTVTASGTADAIVHVSADWFMARGVSLRKAGVDNLTLNQNDGASAALTTGYEYKAIISQPLDGSACIATKGLLALAGASVAPALPAENLFVGTVLVSYHVTASVINTSDITVSAVDGRFKPSIGTGLHVNVAAGRAIMPGARVINRSAAITSVPATATRYMWMDSSGAFIGSYTATPPFVGALPIFSCTTDGSSVTGLTDLRQYVGANRAPGLAVYATNALAITGGLGPGDLFRTNEADPDPLMVVDDPATVFLLAPTVGTMTATRTAAARKVLHRYDWTNAMVAALGAVTAGDIAVCTLRAKEVVTNAYVVINSPDGSANALTVALGTVSAGYIDLIVAKDAKAAANTVYGSATADRGTNLTGYFLSSYTATTVVNAHFVKTTTNLSTVTGSTGSVFIETMLLP